MPEHTNSLAFAREFSRVEDARIVADSNEIMWDETADFVVVGYGGAGVAAANQARDDGLDVIALDRYEGGGATRMNGGIIYAGGGTHVQSEAGYDDTPEEMYIYLARELKGAVTDETLRQFCETGPETIEWLEKHGVRFKANAYPKKISYPSPQYYLYHSDNSLLKRFRTNKRPSPRGHKVSVNVGNTPVGAGIGIFDPQSNSANQAGVRVLSQCDVRQLVVDRNGKVIGLKARRVPAGTPAHKALVKAQQAMSKWLLIIPSTAPGGQVTTALGKYFGRKAARIEAEHSRDFFVRARKGVCLTSGGFIFNEKMVARYAPAYLKTMQLGTPADDGSGILLGHSAGGHMSEMDQVSAWRFINPPLSWPKGMLVNMQGKRFVDEASYGADLGRETMTPENGGRAWLIINHKLWLEAKDNIKNGNLMAFQKLPAVLSMKFSTKRARTIEDLARKTGIDAAGLQQTLEDYRRAAKGLAPDPFEKASEDMDELAEGVWYAINMNGDNPMNPIFSITVGGLLVDENSGLVMRADGTTIPGLYAAGRTAIGLCTYLYLSGLSAGDCIFSGRRAGRHAATAAAEHDAPSQGKSAVFEKHRAAG
ncbi:3-oxo-5alpha-steroid 4-dehydrogenase [Sphingobium xenophagum]|uniref:3-oxo-5alpha-steroid 4-dehydrogenase n=1 Tax=Sphingobium xenophagum TaxID=121428 RepID=A0ABU1X4H3_SPHXE|nr:FAD-binding protein [Sphingobium xenophagum]MDR7156463.1 3-oxo-5alpha-steroid 4-dehydrogenase [Sphingobium xenophagum]